MGLDIKPEYKFNELKKDNELVNAQTQGTYIDNVTKLKDGGFVIEEQGIEYLKSKKVLEDNFEYDDEASMNASSEEFEFNPNNSETLTGQ